MDLKRDRFKISMSLNMIKNEWGCIKFHQWCRWSEACDSFDYCFSQTKSLVCGTEAALSRPSGTPGTAQQACIKEGAGLALSQPITAACPKRPPKHFNFKFKRPDTVDWRDLLRSSTLVQVTLFLN